MNPRLHPLLLCTLATVGCGGPEPALVATDADSAPTAGLPPLELCINEFVADNRSGWTDETGAFADWIEIHNPGEVAIPLEGWSLSDDPADPEKHALSADLIVDAGEYLVFAADGLPERGPTHLSFGLAAAGDAIGLYRADGAGEVLQYGATQADFSWARQPDCCADLATCSAIRWLGSPGVSNAR